MIFYGNEMKYDLNKSNELAKYIYYLIKIGEVFRFYKTKEWLKLKQEVLREQHFECQICKHKGKYTRADTVHHIKFVRIHPQFALSKTYIDNKGKEKINLIAICKECHNKEHPEKLKSRCKTKFMNDERW